MDEPPLYSAPVKHSVTIAGHQTSISLEPVFWTELRQVAAEEGLALNALIARIDDERLEAMRGGGTRNPANLASAVRCWLWARRVGRVSEA